MPGDETTEPLSRRVFQARELMERYPPRWSHPNKQVVYRLACPPGTVHGGEVVYTRWPPATLPETLEASVRAPSLEVHEGVFTYDPPPAGPPAADWHLNFAASDLFCAYGSRLLAQDEMQVAEHPVLAALREALLSLGESTLTVENDQPTPILVTGAERRCRIATGVNPTEGRPCGLYGNRFAEADVETIKRAVTVLDPPTVTNILATEAPSYGSGRYGRDEITFILKTAYSGFLAARVESRCGREDKPTVSVHTGFWGCGAYGGNRVLMTMLQVLAARLAGLDRLVYHTVDVEGTDRYDEAVAILEDDLGAFAGPLETGSLIDEIEAMGFEWGVSDGN